MLNSVLQTKSMQPGQKKLTPEEKAAKSQRLRTGTQALAAAMSVITMTNGPYSKLV